MLDEWRARGLRLNAFTREQGLSPKRLTRWRQRLETAGEASAPAAFHPVQLLGLPESGRAVGGTDRIEIVLGDGCDPCGPAERPPDRFPEPPPEPDQGAGLGPDRLPEAYALSRLADRAPL
jgi:hypothetical protein